MKRRRGRQASRKAGWLSDSPTDGDRREWEGGERRRVRRRERGRDCWM